MEVSLAIAFWIGFATALGWWSAGKVTTQIDKNLKPPAIEQKQEEKGK